MDVFLPLLAVFGGFIAVLSGLTWLAVRARRPGAGGSAVGAALAAWEEAYRVTSHESHHEIKAQAERQVPVLSPDGHWRPDGLRARRAERRPVPPRPRRGRRRLWRLR
ncbi:hypothetical protein [Streptantibioticus ferralitis]|uniref:Secreted protein n=1 Tax=Streptantibioticus ferralitis TaxID=236510 RepID=A0ABT5Z9S0_9ACTN|nr:hypothetical protein [Streptantibioticus ferralitis]MDF2260591.1 hypothetical protein [Streptantibioticus ferralitis]